MDTTTKPPRTSTKPPRMSRKARRAIATVLSLVSVGMVLGAAGLGVYPFYTDLRANRQQKTLKVELHTAETKAAYESRRVEVGSALTRIIIPKTGTDAVVVEGTNGKALAAGAGHYPETPLPGEPGNVGIAGHRTMNGRPFADNDRIRPGDQIILITPFAKHTYVVVPPFGGHDNPWVTTPNDWSVVEVTEEPMLTLTTCHPKGSARERLVVRAKLVSSEPLS